MEAVPTPRNPWLVPPPSADDFARGRADAPVTLLTYCDLQAAECEIFNQVLDRLVDDHREDLRLVFRPFPVPASIVPALDKSELSTLAALAAGNQGHFWELRDILVSQYGEWAQLSPADFDEWVMERARTSGIDVSRFKADLASAETQASAQELYEAATALGISSIPTVFINGRLVERPALSHSGLEASISLTALGNRQFTYCPPFDIDMSTEYTAVFRTERGEFSVRLFSDRAPMAVNSFVFLARQGWFDGTTFHRVIPGFVAQGGDPSGTGQGGPGYYFQNEVLPDLRFDKPGMVGMANAGPDTNGSQFFITYAPLPRLDGAYTVFGEVIDGMDVIESLTPRDPQVNEDLPPGDRINSVTVRVR